MKNRRESPVSDGTIAPPRFHQRAAEIQAYGTVNHLLPLELEETAGDDRAERKAGSRKVGQEFTVKERRL